MKLPFTGRIRVNSELRFRRLHIESLESRRLLAGVPKLVADIRVGPTGSSPNELTGVGAKLFFSAQDNVTGRELWKSDGTDGGTLIVKDIMPGSATPRELTAVDGTLFFTSDAETNGHALWKSDGTSESTVLVSELWTGTYCQTPCPPRPSGLTNVAGTLYFVADDGTSGPEIWKSDGTAAGTSLIKDILPGRPIGLMQTLYSPGSLTAVNGLLFFRAFNEGFNENLDTWITDGTVQGTVRFAEALGRDADFDPSIPVFMDGDFFFAAVAESRHRALWRSDGTSEGTVLLKDFQAHSSSGPIALTNVERNLFFMADDGINGRELWKSDGTSDGTEMVRDIRLGAESSNLGQLTDVDGKLFFSADDGIHGHELWKSDGTEEGTVLVKDIWPGADRALFFFVQQEVVNGTLYFTANDSQTGVELWQSDGTAAGTFPVADIFPGSGSSQPSQFIRINDTLFFTANDGTHGEELWILVHLPDLPGDTNGDGRVSLADLNNVRNHFGQTGPGVIGDTNGDGVVDVTDLNNVRNNFGTSTNGNAGRAEAGPKQAPVSYRPAESVEQLFSDTLLRSNRHARNLMSGLGLRSLTAVDATVWSKAYSELERQDGPSLIRAPRFGI